MILCLDLSTHRTGVSLFLDDGTLNKYLNIVPDPNLEAFQKIKFVTDEVKKYFEDADTIVIEGIFLGKFKGFFNVTTFEYLARLSGAVIYAWLSQKNSTPVIFKASEARKLAGIKGTCQKAEVQMYVIEKYDWATKDEIYNYKAMIEAVHAKLQEKDISQAVFKSRMEKISQNIEDNLGIGEDVADSIILGLAYNNSTKKRG